MIRPETEQETGEEEALIRPRRPLRVAAIALLVLAVVGGVGSELVARFVLGLGDPPLYRLDSQTEYELVPNRSYRRFGNSYEVNSYSMRAAEFPREKASKEEVRVLVVGDSVVNGGNRIDQGALATELLKKALAARLGRPVVVGNASAGSWGPVNELGYIKKHGVLAADVVLLVLNSDDLADVPGIEAIGAQWPQVRPNLAIEEVLDRYIGRAVQRVTGGRLGPKPARQPDATRDVVESLGAVRGFIDAVRDRGAKVGIVLHLKRSELEGSPQEGHARLREVAERMGVKVSETGEVFKKALAEGGAEGPYLRGDDVHPSTAGQRLLAGVLEGAVLELMGEGGAGARDAEGVSGR